MENKGLDNKHQLSLVVLTENDEKIVSDILAFANNNSAIEFIIGDNNSKDKTIKLVKDANLSNVKIVENKDKIISELKNECLQHVTGKWISVINSTDKLDSEYLTKIVEFTATNSCRAFSTKKNTESQIRLWNHLERINFTLSEFVFQSTILSNETVKFTDCELKISNEIFVTACLKAIDNHMINYAQNFESEINKKVFVNNLTQAPISLPIIEALVDYRNRFGGEPETVTRIWIRKLISDFNLNPQAITTVDNQLLTSFVTYFENYIIENLSIDAKIAINAKTGIKLGEAGNAVITKVTAKKFQVELKAANDNWILNIDGVSHDYKQFPIIKEIDNEYEKIIEIEVPYDKHLSEITITNDYTVVKQILPAELHFIRNKKNSFSFIIPIYNVEDYLAECLESLVALDYDLNKIEVLLIDDGSVDNSAKIAKEWAKKYPKFFKYFYQKNQGQATARNFGLEKAKNNWLVFLDSDDFVPPNYLRAVSEAMIANQDTQFFSAKLVFYYEELAKLEDTHILTYRYRYASDFYKVDLNGPSNKRMFNMAIGGSFYERATIKKMGINFVEIKPTFEDAHFFYQFLQHNSNANVCYVSNTYYGYRQRQSGTSAVDTCITDPRFYVDILKDAHLDIIDRFKDKDGKLPVLIQAMILNDIRWTINLTFNSPTVKPLKLTAKQSATREKYLKKIFSYLDFEEVLDNKDKYDITSLIGFNNRYYNNKYSVNAFVREFGEGRDTIKFELFSADLDWKFRIDGIEYTLNDLNHKVQNITVNDIDFIKQIHIAVDKNFDQIDIIYKNEIKKIHSHAPVRDNVKFASDKIMIFVDREERADDNAEVFYDWMMENHPEYTNCYFAISSKSACWKRLAAKGFKLVDIDSAAYDSLYSRADYLLSSGYEYKFYNHNKMRVRREAHLQYIFLQHGVTTDDMSAWFRAFKLNGFVSGAKFEQKFLKEETLFMDNEIIKSGFPRYDKLVDKSENIILLQPTWRSEYKEYSLEEYKQSSFHKNLVKLFSNEKFISYLKDHDYQLHYVSHPNFEKFSAAYTQFESETIKILKPTEIIYRDQFAKAKLQVTDYSSVFGDFIYMNKPVIFFQSDRKSFYESHSYDQYVSYEEMGIGPVISKVDQLISTIIEYVEDDCKLKPEHKKNVKDLFYAQDQNNCQRLFDTLRKKY